jgi:chromosomal replication initiation ATPase DnaA
MTTAERAYMARRLPRTFRTMRDEYLRLRAAGQLPMRPSDRRRARLTGMHRARHLAGKAQRLSRLDARLRRMPAAAAVYESRCELIRSLLVQHTGFSWQQLVSSRRTQDLALARQAGMVLMLRHTHLNLPQVGELFGGRDHTTVLHARDKVAAQADLFRHIIDPIEQHMGVV